MTRATRSWSRARSCGRCSPCWPCTPAGWSPPSSWSTRCGVRTRRRRCATACRGWRPSCGGRWARPTSSSCAAAGYALDLPAEADRRAPLRAAASLKAGRRPPRATCGSAVDRLAEADSAVAGRTARRLRLRGLRVGRDHPAVGAAARRRSRSGSTSSSSSAATREQSSSSRSSSPRIRCASGSAGC